MCEAKNETECGTAEEIKSWIGDVSLYLFINQQIYDTAVYKEAQVVKQYTEVSKHQMVYETGFVRNSLFSVRMNQLQDQSNRASVGAGFT